MDAKGSGGEAYDQRIPGIRIQKLLQSITILYFVF